ncbi:hypothetical protein ACP4OV_010707 [Aristida adscensionis]
MFTRRLVFSNFSGGPLLSGHASTGFHPFGTCNKYRTFSIAIFIAPSWSVMIVSGCLAPIASTNILNSHSKVPAVSSVKSAHPNRLVFPCHVIPTKGANGSSLHSLLHQNSVPDHICTMGFFCNFDSKVYIVPSSYLQSPLQFP